MQDTLETTTRQLDSPKDVPSTKNSLHAHPTTTSSPANARKTSPSLQRTKSFKSKSKASSPSNGSTFYIDLPPVPKRQKSRSGPAIAEDEGRKSKYFDSRNSSLAFSRDCSTSQASASTLSASSVASSTQMSVESSTRRSSRLPKKEKGNEKAGDYSSEKEIKLAQPIQREPQTKPVKKRRIRTNAPSFVAPAYPASLPLKETSSLASRVADDHSLNQNAVRAQDFSRSPCPSPTLIELKVELTDEAVSLPSFGRQATVSRSYQANFELNDTSAPTVSSPSQIHASSSRFESLNPSASAYTETSTPATATQFSHATTPAHSSSLAAYLLSVAPDFYLTSNSFLQLDFLAPLFLSLRLRSFSALRDLPACILRSYLDHAQTNYETQGSPQGVIKTEDWDSMKDLLCNVLIEREGTSKKFFDTVLF